MWSIETSHSKMYKLIAVKKDMTSKEFMEKISKLFKIKLGYFSVGYSLLENPEMQVELDMDDSEGFENAYCLFHNFSKLKVVMKTQISGNITLAMGKRTVRDMCALKDESAARIDDTYKGFVCGFSLLIPKVTGLLK